MVEFVVCIKLMNKMNNLYTSILELRRKKVNIKMNKIKKM